MNRKLLEILIKKGNKLLKSPRKIEEFTDNILANELINDLDNYPHAFVIASISDKQIIAERAWMIPYRLKEKLGDFNFGFLYSLSKNKILNALLKPEPLHRFNNQTAKQIYSCLRVIKKIYKGDASRIWSDRPSSSLLVYRFLQFEGVGIKIATMASNILVRGFKIPVSDKYSIDISPDIQVMRVFKRLGLINNDAGNDELIYMARSLYPKYPGIFDFSCWEIGREWCRPKKPLCSECYMNAYCPSSTK